MVKHFISKEKLKLIVQNKEIRKYKSKDDYIWTYGVETGNQRG